MCGEISSRINQVVGRLNNAEGCEIGGGLWKKLKETWNSAP